MGIEIEKRFSVRAPASSVWAFLTDPYRVAGCLPGAAITGSKDERTFTGTIKVKVGPVASSYAGELRFEELDESKGMARLSATGQDTRGKGGARMTMTSHVDQKADLTEVRVASDVAVTGILAQMGRGMIVDVSDQMFQIFTECIGSKLESEVGASGGSGEPGAGAATRDVAGPPAEMEAIDAIALGRAAGKQALGRALRQPRFWILLAVIAAIIALVLR